MQALDGPYLGLETDGLFAASAARARDLGFDGKWAIHPKQVSALNEVFTPSAAEVQHAEDVLSALERGRDVAAGAVVLGGEMVDQAVAVAARRMLHQAGALR